MLEFIFEAKTGMSVPSVTLGKMSEEWLKLRKRAEAYNAQALSLHQEFIDYMGRHYSHVKTMADVREEMAREFMATIEAEDLAPATFNKKLDMLRSCFNSLASKAGIVKNPFREIEEQEEETINRLPFNEAELKRILTVLEQDKHAFIRPALITAIYTAMRRADCCLLRKSAVNLAKGRITVRIAKTRKQIQIPLMDPLRTLIESLPTNDSEYLFPALARQFELNPKLITERTKAVLHDAGFAFTDEGPNPDLAMSVSRESGKGVRRASTRDFHSFRSTWVTLALIGGIPVEMVCLVTGHTSPDTLRKHYFLPDYEDFKRVLSDKLPTVLGGKPKTGPGKIDLLSAIEAKLGEMRLTNWHSHRDELIEMIKANKLLG